MCLSIVDIINLVYLLKNVLYCIYVDLSSTDYHLLKEVKMFLGILGSSRFGWLMFGLFIIAMNSFWIVLSLCEFIVENLDLVNFLCPLLALHLLHVDLHFL